MITINGDTKTIKKWCEYVGMHRDTYYYRIRTKQMTPEEAIMTPLKKPEKRHVRDNNSINQ